VSALALLVTAFGASGALWAWQSRAQRRLELRSRQAISERLDEGMQVALHLSQHAASSRGQALGPAHLVYAIVRDESVIAAIETLGGSIAEIENASEAALDAPEAGGDPRAGNQILGTALHIAGYQSEHVPGERRMSCTDVLSVLVKRGCATVLERPPLSPYALLFQLVHGSQPPTTLAGETHVHVVLRNDNYTTQELVVTILREVFDLAEADAIAVMRKAHEGTRAIVGRFAAELARTKIELARGRARDAGSPLWLGVEVC
jgi:ATP-dependent Clp protease adapter protein ClpS